MSKLSKPWLCSKLFSKRPCNEGYRFGRNPATLPIELAYGQFHPAQAMTEPAAANRITAATAQHGPARSARQAAPVGWAFGCGAAMGGEGSEAALERVRIVPATCLGLHVRRASRIVTQIYDAALQPAGLAMNQFSLLVAIHLLDGLPMARLAQELDCDQTTLSRNLRPLLRQGWVVIQPGQDRRVRQVSLTPGGREVLEKALPLWERVQAELSEHYGPESWQALLGLLQRTRTLRDPEARSS